MRLINKKIYNTLHKVWVWRNVTRKELRETEGCYTYTGCTRKLFDGEYSYLFCKKKPSEIAKPRTKSNDRKTYLFLTPEGKRMYELMDEIYGIEQYHKRNNEGENNE